jgi:hypothetical protein
VGGKVIGEGPGTGAEYAARAAATTFAANPSMISVSAGFTQPEVPDATNFTAASDNENTSEQPIGNYWDPQRRWAFSHLQQKRPSFASTNGSTKIRSQRCDVEARIMSSTWQRIVSVTHSEYRMRPTCSVSWLSFSDSGYVVVDEHHQFIQFSPSHIERLFVPVVSKCCCQIMSATGGSPVRQIFPNCAPL